MSLLLVNLTTALGTSYSVLSNGAGHFLNVLAKIFVAVRRVRKVVVYLASVIFESATERQRGTGVLVHNRNKNSCFIEMN